VTKEQLAMNRLAHGYLAKIASGAGAFGVVALVTASCGAATVSTTQTRPAQSLAANPPAAATPQTGVAPASGTPAAPSVAAAGGAVPAGTANPAARVNGRVQTVASAAVTLADGTSFDVTPTTRIIRQQPMQPADLKPGLFVAITAMRQPDNTLLASIVSVFPASLSSNVPGGQRPLPQGNLMTNATIDQVSGNSFTVSFPGGGARVTLAPNAQVIRQVDATPADITAGVMVSASVSDGKALSVMIQ
jgi:hypothetical protein